MEISGINCRIPSKEISNQEVLDLIHFYSRKSYSGDIDNLLNKISAYLRYVGSETRFWRSKKEKPIDMILQSINESVNMSGINIKDINLILFASIDRGFLEPANSNFIANALGIPNVRNFDIVDACMGWCTACNVSQNFFQEEFIENILIVCSECAMDEEGAIFPQAFTIHSENELKWKFPSFTIGEAVTSTILTKNQSKTWKFIFDSKSEKADLCNVPLYKFKEYNYTSEKLGKSGNMKFTSFGTELSKNGYESAIKVMKKLLEVSEKPNLIFPHSVSQKVHQIVSSKLSIEKNIYSTFQFLGNVATCSIPSCIYSAYLNKRLKNREKAFGWIASGGMKFSAFEIYLK